MNTILKSILILIPILLWTSCSKKPEKDTKAMNMTAEKLLGNPDYLAISYGGYRENSREIQPTLDQLKEDMRILAAADIKLLRTYNVSFPHASNVLKAIREIKKEDPQFEMYVMLGAWIDCENAWTDQPNHDSEDEETNRAEINRAVELANEYPDIVKIIAVGNEAMVKWATSYYVQASVILRWVTHLQELKASGKLRKDLWITSSDNFASWGGGDEEYRTEDLENLLKAVDFISMHTYPMHDTHYNPAFWIDTAIQEGHTDLERINVAMRRAKNYAIEQYQAVLRFARSIGVEKPIHIGETGWASFSNGHYGAEGSKATDEYKEALYYKLSREWTEKEGISCFYFEAFDETWKDAQNTGGSENHFGLFTVDGQAKYVLWNLVDRGRFEGLTRGGSTISKTYNGDKQAMLEDVLAPPMKELKEID